MDAGLIPNADFVRKTSPKSTTAGSPAKKAPLVVGSQPPGGGHAGLAEIDLQRSRDLPKLANAAAQKAVELDDSLPAAHHALARAHVSAWNWKAANPAFRRALQLDPTSTDIRVDYASNYLNMMGRFEESLELLRPLLANDPTSRILRTAIGGTLLQAGRYDEAIGAYTENLALQKTPGTLTFMGSPSPLRGGTRKRSNVNSGLEL
jgi:tetratricopeptide (TPR) repeat protein